MSVGKVYFVGAGPGDPGLLPIKSVDILQTADVILYDRLVSAHILKYTHPQARLIYCGKEAGSHTVSQDEINSILLREAKRGHLVVRLKGGDPCIFGRVGEEAEVCARYQIDYEIVPGITSGIAVPAYAGIPLTHREWGSNVALISGHQCTANEATPANWSAIAAFDTIVVYMGVGPLQHISEQLRHYGKPAATPAALIRWGTTSEQQTIVGTIGDIAERARAAAIKSPAILVVGEVVELRKVMNWYEEKPLFGRKVFYLGDTPQEDTSAMVSQGAEVVDIPFTTQIVSLAHYMVQDIGNYDWIVFGDGREVQSFFDAMLMNGKDIREVNARLVAADAASVTELNRRGILADIDLSQVAERDQGKRPLLTRDTLDFIGTESGERVLLLTSRVKDQEFLPRPEATKWFVTSLYSWKLPTLEYVSHWLDSDSTDFDTLCVSGMQGWSMLQELMDVRASWARRLERIPNMMCIGEEVAMCARSAGWDVSLVVPANMSQTSETIAEWTSSMMNSVGGRAYAR